MPVPGPLALVGSGEFLPAMAGTDRDLLQGRAPRVAVVPAAAAPEGDASLRRWFDLAHVHYRGLDADVVEVDVRSREAADDPRTADLLGDVGLVYLSGGNPAFLADLLRGTALGRAIAERWRAGAAVAGCSAGAMALGHRTLAVRGGAVEGLGLAQVVVIPHFDRLGFARRLVGGLADVLVDTDVAGAVVGIDEDTAVVWSDGPGWVVTGRGQAWIVDTGGLHRTAYAVGDRVPLPPPA
jgi:cyanophycinase